MLRQQVFWYAVFLFALAGPNVSYSSGGCSAGGEFDVIGIRLGGAAPQAARTLAAHVRNRPVVHKFDAVAGSEQRFLTEIKLGAVLDPNNPVQAPFIPGPGYSGEPLELPAWAKAGRGGDETVNVGFSLPPSSPCVQGIYRQRTYRWQDGPAYARVVAGLTSKYGSPRGRQEKQQRVRLTWHWPESAHLCVQLVHTINLNVNLARVVSPAPKGKRCATELLTEIVYEARTPDKPVVRLRTLLIDGEGSARNILAFKGYVNGINERQRQPERPSL